MLELGFEAWSGWLKAVHKSLKSKLFKMLVYLLNSYFKHLIFPLQALFKTAETEVML